MPTKKTLRRGPSNRVPKKISSVPEPRTAAPPSAAPTNESLLLKVAMTYHARAMDSKDPDEVAIARVVDAAWLIQWRRERGIGEPAGPEFASLERAAAKYLATRTDAERWWFARLPPQPYADRTSAIKVLCSYAAEAVAQLRDKPYDARTPVAAVVARSLLAKVEELGLAADRVDRTPSEREPPLETKAWSALLDELLARRPRVDRVAALAMHCRGVSRGLATNWTRAAIDTPVK